MARVYTRTGDKGQSGLADGRRLAKSDIRFELLGTLDEASGALGAGLALAGEDFSGREAGLQAQHDLFTLGAIFAGAELTLADEVVPTMEAAIDALDKTLPLLKNFVLQGGNTAAAMFHLARAIARRAERVRLRAEKETGPLAGGVFLNRLSDLLFVLARLAAFEAGAKEIIWRA